MLSNQCVLNISLSGLPEANVFEKHGASYLGDLPLVTSISSRNIIRQRLWSRELVIRRRCSNNISLSRDLSCESGNWSSDYKEECSAPETCETAG
jgi:hypothetical protein